MFIRSYLLKIFLMLIVFFTALFNSCNTKSITDPIVLSEVKDLEEIKKREKLIAITDFNSIDYFIFKGQPLGFQYELLQELSDHLGLPIEVKVNNDLQQNFESLARGECDLLASNLTITRSRMEQLEFTYPHSQSRQVLVQRTTPEKVAAGNKVSPFISNPLDLGGKTVYVRQGSVYSQRLQNLSEEIGQKINVAEVPLSSEQLIKLVSQGDIDYTIADESIAKVNKRYYPHIDIDVAISFSQNQAWAVRKGASDLKNEIDLWMEDFRKTRKYAVLYHKYFVSSNSANIVSSQYYYPETGRISYYDEIIKRESEKIGWDWRLIASLVYQESRFNPEAVSHAGAFGLMQLMPATAARFNVDEFSSPEEHIKAGVKYIDYLDRRLSELVIDPVERVKFVLASYNAGIGHVLDAIRLAEKLDKDPQIWTDHVEYCLMKKSDPEIYNDELVRNGYLKGTETFAFVRNIVYRYNHYLNVELVDLAQLFPQDQ
jgi:membrane-bound lytic murein transglycosylase F